MPPQNFRQLSVAQFVDLVRRYPFTRKVDAVHMHHTWSPTKADYVGRDTIVGMWRYHTQENGWSDIAQHVTVAPDGTVWTGRSWNLAPASAKGYNGNSRSGPFMFETVGNFDRGHERLEGAQRDAVLTVIAAVQERFALAPESLRFHNAMTDEKTCPGTSLPYAEFLDELRRFRTAHPWVRTTGRSRGAAQGAEGAEGARGAFGDEQLETRAATDEAMRLLLAAASEARAAGETDDGEPDEEATDTGRARALRDADGGDARAAARGAGLDPEEIAELAPHVINLNQGVPSTGGLFESDENAIRAVFEEHIPRWRAQQAGAGPLRLLFFAHGGLVSELGGLLAAKRQIDFWRANGVYPVCFVWETGFGETLGQLLARAARGARGPLDALVDRTTDPLIASFCHAAGGVGVWGAMKYAAEQASRPGGGAYIAAEALDALLPTLGDDAAAVELHAVGHSAGAILLSHFIAMIAARAGQQELRLPAFRTVHFLAPAIRVDTFKETLWPLTGPGNAAEWLTVFTMRDALERADDCVVYRKSLLYLIREGLEPRQPTDILGLETSLRRDPDLRALYLAQPQLPADVAKRGEVIWSKTTAAQADARGASTATAHGSFDNDPPTMDSVARRVLDVAAGAPLPYPFSKARERHTSFAEKLGAVTVAPLAFLGDLLKWRALDADTVAEHGSRGAEFPDDPASAPSGRPSGRGRRAGAPPAGRRRALCIGIDTYPAQPLSGCVNDARLWRDTLAAMGFETQLLTNERATRTGILHALESLVSAGRPGDVLAIQYSGHGTTVPDVDGDETGGYNGRRDEALCPVNFATGALLVDDDVADVLGRAARGVSITCFFDCCHSGTITRFAIGDPAATEAAGHRARYVVATPALVQAHREFRRTLGAQSRSARGPAGMREIVFSACRDDEVAWENEGQGDFTRYSIAVLRQEGRVLTNRQFRARVVAAFGQTPKQHPVLDAAPSALDGPLLAATPRAGSGDGDVAEVDVVEADGGAVAESPVAEESDGVAMVTLLPAADAGGSATAVLQLLQSLVAILAARR